MFWWDLERDWPEGEWKGFTKRLGIVEKESMEGLKREFIGFNGFIGLND